MIRGSCLVPLKLLKIRSIEDVLRTLEELLRTLEELLRILQGFFKNFQGGEIKNYLVRVLEPI